MKKYIISVINNDNEIKFSNECKSKKEVKNIIKFFGGKYHYKTTKNNKLVKSLTSKSALNIINNCKVVF